MPKPYKMTYKLACLYQCHDCSGVYIDGKVDCETPTCPIYPFMPYRDKNNNPDLVSLEYNPRKKGKITWDENPRELSQEHIDKMQKARQEAIDNPKKKKKKVVKPIEFKKVIKKRKKSNDESQG